MGSTGILKILGGLSKSRSNFGEKLIEAGQKLAKKTQKTTSRVSLSGEELKLLPKELQTQLSGLKKPKVNLGYNAGQGQTTFGASLYDGNRPVGGFAMNYDIRNASMPIFKARVTSSMPDAGAERVFNGAFTFNPTQLTDDLVQNIGSRRNGIFKFEIDKSSRLQVSASLDTKKAQAFTERTGIPLPEERHLAEAAENFAEKTPKEVEDYFSVLKPKSKAVKKKQKAVKEHHYGKHKIGRYLYHLTNETNYKQIQESGRLKISNDGGGDPLSGVFMFDIGNLTRRWRRSNSWGKEHLASRLLFHTAKGEDKLVMLRIPTKSLNHDLLKLRSQNRLFSAISKNQEVSFAGEPAKFNNLYKQRKEAIEFVYTQDIPLKDVQCAGRADLSQIQGKSGGKEVLATLKKLFDGQPEMKGLEKIN